MTKQDLDKVIEVMKREKFEAIACAKKCEWLMKKTINPFRKLICKRDIRRFMDHAVGIDLAIYQIKKEFES